MNIKVTGFFVKVCQVFGPWWIPSTLLNTTASEAAASASLDGERALDSLILWRPRAQAHFKCSTAHIWLLPHISPLSHVNVPTIFSCAQKSYLQCPHVHIFLNPNIEKLYLVRKVWNALFGCSHGYTYAMALAFTTSTVAKELWESLSEAAAAWPRHELRKKLRRLVGGGCVFAALDTLALRPHSPNISWNSCNDERLRLIWSRGLPASISIPCCFSDFQL